MSKIIIEINTDNAAFTNSASDEIARILQWLSTKIKDSQDLGYFKLRDINGNSVGFMDVQEDK